MTHAENYAEALGEMMICVPKDGGDVFQEWDRWLRAKRDLATAAQGMAEDAAEVAVRKALQLPPGVTVDDSPSYTSPDLMYLI